MTGRSDGATPPDPPSILWDSPKIEFELHQEFILRHVDFLIDTLTGEQSQSDWQHPAGCPTATPEIQCRKRNSGHQFPCRYESLTAVTSQTTCDCGDPLAGSDDPLDTVAAVVIAQDDQTPAERYFNHEDRRIIADLRDRIGTWKEIDDLDRSELSEALCEMANRPGFGDHRVNRLIELLEYVSELEKTDGVTLRGLKGLRYSKFAELLSRLPGVSRSDAWWLMLVAFDKPVWPADPFVDGLLCSLGLLEPKKYNRDTERREFLEDELVSRQIPQFHRALAGHAVKGGVDQCGEACEIRKFLLSYRLRKQSSLDSEPVVVDLFSGAGGLSAGFRQAGWTIELALDKDEDATDTYRLNHPEIPHRKVICGDIREEVEHGLIEKINRQPDVIVGGPPCQSLSLAGYRSRLADDEEYSILEDDRTELYQDYVEVIKKLRPKMLVMENVEGIVNEIRDTDIKVVDLVIEALESIGAGNNKYICDYERLECAKYGIPQNRERVLIFGIREDLIDQNSDNNLEELFDRLFEADSTDEVTLRQALSGLPKIRRGEGGRVVPDRAQGTRSNYVERNGLYGNTQLTFNHQAREHPMEKDQILFDEALEPGDTGWDVKYAKDGEYAHLIEYDVGTEENPRFKDKYRMLKWDEPAPTVVAHLAKDANNFVLPDYYEYVPDVTGDPDNRRNRGITPREAARLQSFPDEFIFLGPFTSWFRQIGNAVPPLLGKHIAKVVEQYLESKTRAEKFQLAPDRAITGTDD